jgi:hypothetical protein
MMIEKQPGCRSGDAVVFGKGSGDIKVTRPDVPGGTTTIEDRDLASPTPHGNPGDLWNTALMALPRGLAIAIDAG